MNPSCVYWPIAVSSRNRGIPHTTANRQYGTRKAPAVKTETCGRGTHSTLIINRNHSCIAQSFTSTVLVAEVRKSPDVAQTDHISSNDQNIFGFTGPLPPVSIGPRTLWFPFVSVHLSVAQLDAGVRDQLLLKVSLSLVSVWTYPHSFHENKPVVQLSKNDASISRWI